MKFIQKVTWDLDNLEYYRDELGWDVDSIEDVVKCLEDWNDEELYLHFGRPIDYEYWAEE